MHEKHKAADMGKGNFAVNGTLKQTKDREKKGMDLKWTFG